MREVSVSPPTTFTSLFFLILFTFTTTPVAGKHTNSSTSSSSSAAAAYTPDDNYLINCGSSQSTKLPDGRTFKSDPQSSSYLSTDEDVQTSVSSISVNGSSSMSMALYLSARIFPDQSTYSFSISRPGRHWIRLYFHPLPHPLYNLTSAVFTVSTDQFVLLDDFSVRDNSTLVFKEYLVNVPFNRVDLVFSPNDNSVAFVNAIELVSAPDSLIPDSAAAVSPVGNFSGLSKHALEVTHRMNVGGPLITPENDTLSRTWTPDTEFMTFPQGAQNVTVSPDVVEYQGGGATQLIAPNWVYATADEMAESNVSSPNFNLTWKMTVAPGYSYLLRMHFCDIVSESLNDLYFNVYINGMMGVSGLDLSSLTGALAVAYYKDFVLNATAITNGSIMVQVGPASNIGSGLPNAILNGLEVMKMSDSTGSLDGFSGGGSFMGRAESKTLKILAGVGLALAIAAMVLVGMMLVRWQKRPKDWEKRNSFSSWLLPIHAGQSTLLSSKSGSRRSNMSGSGKSRSGHSSFLTPGLGLGRFFSFAELQEATRNFDEKAVIGVGGFGKVYIGELDDGTKLAIKRGSANSEQGINEFQTEIQMLSKLRHRHLVSLIGYCDEQSEMILVYEYMANGPLRDHIYGGNLPHLSWKQRLEICIGAARGLHYLHTGAAQGIIHRDVKTTNILLDKNFVAKVSDFGLSKAGPTLEQTHVSTAVKGSFGYLDPEYFRLQQLTEKSDVYSFGVVLFEVLCALPAINPGLPREQVNLAEWAMQCNRKGAVEKIIDPVIAGSISAGALRKFVEAAEKCLAEHGVDRPSMGDVLWNLEYALQIQVASAQINVVDPLDSSTARLLVLAEAEDEQPKDRSEVEVVSVTVSEDSEVTVGSPFSQAGFQGR